MEKIKKCGSRGGMRIVDRLHAMPPEWNVSTGPQIVDINPEEPEGRAQVLASPACVLTRERKFRVSHGTP